MTEYEFFAKKVVDLLCDFKLYDEEVVNEIRNLIDQDQTPELYLRYRQNTGTFA